MASPNKIADPVWIYRMTSFEDEPYTNYIAMDYKKNVSLATKDQLITIKMAKNGGWAAVIEH